MLFITSGCSPSIPACIVPPASLTAQALDLCFLENETDDIAHQGVQDCHSKWMALPDTCETRKKLKAERCQKLLMRNEYARKMSVLECIASLRVC